MTSFDPMRPRPAWRQAPMGRPSRWGLYAALRILCATGLGCAVALPARTAAAQGGALPAEAEAAAAPALQDLIDAGTAHFQNKRYGEALAAYEQALQRPGAPLPRLRYAIARCYQQLGRYSEALRAFEAFLALPEAPSDVRRKATNSVEQLRQRLSRGRLLLRVTPDDAEVHVDGNWAGRTPLAPVELSVGPHMVRVRAPGYAEVTEAVDVPPAGDITLVVPLARLGGANVGLQGGAGRGGQLMPWAWATFALGLAAVAGGSAAYALGEQDHRDIVESPGYGTPAVQLTHSRALDLEAQGDLKKTVGYALWGVGGASLITATTLFIVATTRPAAPRAAQKALPLLRVGEQGAVVGLATTF